MFKCMITLLCLLSVYSVAYGKSFYKHKRNAGYDLSGEGAISFAHFWQNTNSYDPHPAHYGPVGDGGYNYEKPRHHSNFGEPLGFDDPFNFGSGEFEEPKFHGHHKHREHGGGRHHPGHHPGHHHQHHGNGYQYNKPGNGYHYNKPDNGNGYHYDKPEPPRRFPPPPVYDESFINPWAGVTTPVPTRATVKPIPNTTFRTPTKTTKATTTIAPTTSSAPVTKRTTTTTSTTTTTTTPTPTTVDPLSTTTNEDGLIYDIDLRFGQSSKRRR